MPGVFGADGHVAGFKLKCHIRLDAGMLTSVLLDCRDGICRAASYFH